MMDHFFPNRKEGRDAAPRGRTVPQMLAILSERERIYGPSATIDEEFIRDVEEGRRLLRNEA